MKTFSLEQKQAMHAELKELVEASGLSANKYATERLGFSSGSKLNHVLKNWDKNGLVGHETWVAIERHLNQVKGYVGVATNNLMKIWDVCERAYAMKKAIVISGEGGLGKTYALGKYKQKIERERRFEVIYLDASMTKTRKQFIVALMEAIGCYKAGYISVQVPLIRKAMEKKNALVIIDEVSSFKGDIVTILKDIMTALKDVCGIVMAGTPYFVNNLNKGASKDKHLFSETKDRLFMLPESLSKPTEAEAEAIFKANGLQGEALNIVMGRNKNMMKYSYKSKQTFRGISDCIAMIDMISQENKSNVKPLQIL